MDRREWLRWSAIGAGAAGLPWLANGAGQAPWLASAQAQAPTAAKQAGALKITDVQAILTQPARSRLVTVKVTTSEPGLYGLGCATFTQRARVVETAVNQYLKPFLIGKDPNADRRYLAIQLCQFLLAEWPRAGQCH